MSINLLPEDLGTNHKKRGQKSIILVIAVLYGFFFVSTNGYLYHKIKTTQHAESRWQSLQTEYQSAGETLAQLEVELKSIQEEKNVLEALLDKKQQQSVIISLIMDHIPKYLRVQRLLVTEEGWAALSGEALLVEDVSLLIGALEKTPMVDEVMLTELEVDRHTGVAYFVIDLFYHQ